jgi:CD109 antigen
MTPTPLLVLVATVVASLVHGHDVKYLIAAPSEFRSGLDYKLSASLTANVDNAQISAKIIETKSQDVIASTIAVQMARGESEILTITIPEEVTGSSFSLVVTGSGGVSFEETKPLTLKSNSLMPLLQTDKAIYKPGDKVNFRAVVLKPTLLVYTGDMELEITDAKSNKIMQKSVMKSDLTKGVYTGELQLHDYSAMGTWKYEVKAAGQSNMKTFKVEEYVLPKYEVLLDVPEDYTVEDGNLDFKVTAKYTFGQAVKGSVVITSRFGYPRDSFIQEHRGELKDGEFKVSMDLSQIYSLCPKSYCDSEAGMLTKIISQSQLKVTANVTETLTGQTFTKDGQVNMMTQPLTIQIQGPDSFKSKLKYTGVLKISGTSANLPPRALLNKEGNLRQEYVDNNLVLEVTYRFTTTNTQDDGTETETKGEKKEKLEIAFDRSGEMKFELDIKDKFDSIDMMAQLPNNGPINYKSVTEFSTRDDHSLQVSLPGVNGKIKGNDFAVNVQSTQPISSLNYVVTSKGLVVTSERLTFAATTEHQFTYNIESHAHLAPSARILVWTYSEGGEVIVDSVEMEIDGVFSNQMSLQFERSKAKPGEDINVNIVADPDSFIGILAVDKSATLNGGSNDFTVVKMYR